MNSLSVRMAACLSFVTAFSFLNPTSLRAAASANSQLSFTNLSISASSGTLVMDPGLQGTAFAQATLNQQYNNAGTFPGASAAGDFSTASARANTSSLFGMASANANVPGATAASDEATGQGSLIGSFMITGGTGSVNAIFSTTISGSLSALTDSFGESAGAETIFSLEVDGSSVLFDDRFYSIGSNASQSQPFSTGLNGMITLQYNTDYTFFAQADTEVSVSNLPEPGTVSLLCAGTIMLWMGFRRNQRRQLFGKKTIMGAVMLPALLAFVNSSRAMYVGAEVPDICPTCGAQTSRLPAGGAATSLTEGNLRQDYPVVTLQGGNGPTANLSLIYNSYDADGSKAQVDSGFGLGWTHSYDIFLFQQRGSFFRMGADGRVTIFQLGFNGYTADNGYFESLTPTGGNTYAITNKNQSWWHFSPVPNTPFLLEGPVYRLTAMGDRNGNVTTLTYDANGLLVQVTDQYGRTLTFGYTNKHLTTVTDPLGRTTQFQYDARFRTLTRITDPAGNVTRYSYNSLYQMTKKIDRDGRTYLYLYRSQRPWAVMDGSGQSWFSMLNPSNWSIDRHALALTLRRQFNPSTTTTTDGNGNLWNYQYDTNGYITQVTAPDGATTSYTYDAGTREISSITNANGAVTRFQYDTEGNRTNMTDALGEVTTYTYEPNFNELTSMTDPIGRVTTYQYDASGNRVREIDPLLETNSWTYDSHGNMLSTTDRNGHTTTYAYDLAGNETNQTDALGHTTTYAYDAVGNRLSMTDPLGRTTHYQYDALDRMTNTTDALGGVMTYGYDALGRQTSVTDQNTNTTTYQYDLRGRLIQTTDPLGGTIQYGYDADNNRIAGTNQLGHATTYGYDTQNRLTATTDPMGRTMQYNYDPSGNRISATDQDTNTTTYAYDPLNRMVATTNALGGVTRYDYSSPGGPPCCSPTPGSSLMTEMVDPDGNVTFYHYDDLNRRVQVVRKNSDTNDIINPKDAATTTIYDAAGNIIYVTDPNTNTTAYTYDAINRQVSKINPAGDTTITRYDADGNVIESTAPNNNTTTNGYDALNRIITVYDEIGLVRSNAYDPDGNILSSSDGLGHVTRYQYDGLNRQVETLDPLGQMTTTAYDADGNVTQTIDRNAYTTQYFYDPLDRRTSTMDPLGNTTVTTYDGDGNVIAVTDGNGHTTSYSYDTLNRRTTETYPDAPPNTRTYQYDPAGNLIQRIDQTGRITTYSYNDLYYLTNRAYSPSGVSDKYTYDNGGRMLSGNRNGWTDTFVYDGADRIIGTTQNGRVLTYTYDVLDRVQTNTQPSGRTLIYSYDARNRLVTLEDGTPNPPIVTYDYDDGDRVMTRTYRNGTTATYTYNANNWITSLEHSNATLIAGFTYAYDNEGNRLYEQKLDDPSDSETYLYDALNRLTNYDVGMLSGSTIPIPAIAKAWALDPLGNWNTVTSNGTPVVRVHGPSNELLTDNGNTYFYDANGNLTQDSAYNYTYDEENRLTQVQRRSDLHIVGRYRYDALNRRVERIALPNALFSTNRYYYDDSRVIEEQGITSAAIAQYTYGAYVDDVLTMNRAGHTYYYHGNALWSPHALSDETGAVAERYAYDVYGHVIVMDAGYVLLPLNPWGAPHSVITNRFLFTGRELDEEDGLYQYRNRYYDCDKGRFLQRDPLNYVDGMNLYEYVRSRPTVSTDPDGLKQELGVDTSVNPKPGKCGKMDFHVPWSLTQAAAKDGQIVQAITFTWEVKDCDGNVLLSPPPWLSPLSYYEAWKVSKGATKATPEKDDWVWFGTKPFGGKCTVGHVEIKAKARFYDGLTRLPGYFVPRNPRTLAGILYSAEASAVPAENKTRFDDPKAMGTPALERELSFKWNCCPDKERDTEVVSKKP